MKRNLFLLCIIALPVIFSCKKSHSSNNTGPGNDVNTWTFKEGSNKFSGVLLFDAQLNTLLQGNNSYTFSMIGPESTTANMFNVILSLPDLNFTAKSFQTGVDGTDAINGFYYFEAAGSANDIYKSSNYEPGKVMTFTVTGYDSAKDIVTLSFSGKAADINGDEVTITDGKVTAKIERQ